MIRRLLLILAWAAALSWVTMVMWTAAKLGEALRP